MYGACLTRWDTVLVGQQVLGEPWSPNEDQCQFKAPLKRVSLCISSVWCWALEVFQLSRNVSAFLGISLVEFDWMMEVAQLAALAHPCLTWIKDLCYSFRLFSLWGEVLSLQTEFNLRGIVKCNCLQAVAQSLVIRTACEVWASLPLLIKRVS